MSAPGRPEERDVLDLCRKEGVRFLRLQFTDILGTNKNVEVPEGQFEKALHGENCFHDPSKDLGLSDTAMGYIGGLLDHAKGMCAVTNPLVNSFKRLVPGYEAPTAIVWSEQNRSPLVRVPARRGEGTRVELRSPDPSCNPYLAFAVMIAAGIDGIRRKLDPGGPVAKNIFAMSHREKRRLRIDDLPADLRDALAAMKKDPLIREVLGDHLFAHFMEAKSAAWADYSATVHPWEVDRYLARF